ncbi:MAG: cyclase family protein [Candidatus Kariarchaeaceae archaeon]|jgi:kynurenine formamidase
MLQLQIIVDNDCFDLLDPISVSREILIEPEVKTSNAFSLPKFKEEVFELNGFIGDIDQGGSCNVGIHTFCPHGFTHIETAAHITNEGLPINKIPVTHFSGLVYLMDLSYLESEKIGWDDIKPKINDCKLPITMLAIKTKNSLISQFYDFSGSNPIFLDPIAAKKIVENIPKLTALILDFPSIDKEDDGGKLFAHKNYFGMSHQENQIQNDPYRVLVELAYFSDLKEGYYYCSMTPPKIQTNAVITDIILYRMVKR